MRSPYFSVPMAASVVLMASLAAALEGPQAPKLAFSSQRVLSGQNPEYGQLPLYFVANQGQISATQVEYYLTGAQQTVYFTKQGLTLARHDAQKGAGARSVVKLDFVDANPQVQIQGQLPQQAAFSYFLGAQKEWHTNIPSYTQVQYSDLWPGIDLVYRGEVGRLKYQFVVHPGADPKQIRLRYRGVASLAVQAEGELQVCLTDRKFTDQAPTAFLNTEQSQSVSVRYALETGSMEYGFELGAYDLQQTLIIDPALLVYCGYLGGSGVDTAFGIALDDQKRAYLVGTTWSNELSFPVTVGPDLSANGPSYTSDAFVARLNPQGTALEYCGYLGGLKNDWGRAICVDEFGAAYITGDTNSDENSFPVLVGPDLSFNSNNNEWDAFVAKITADGTGLEYCGYLGGAEEDRGAGIAVDGMGQAYLTGYSKSDETTFPVLVGPDLSHNTGPDAFVARVNPTGTALDYCGYLGGMSFDTGEAIAIDALGRAYITGSTYSDEGTFPVLVGPDLSYNNGWDAYIARVNASGSALEYCGYLGGELYDVGYGIAVDPQYRAFLTGTTYSDQSTFPVIAGPDLSFNGYCDAFLASVSADGTTLNYCGYLGGAGFDYGHAIALDSLGNATIAGRTTSGEGTFPILEGPGLTFSGLDDAFLARVNSVGTRLDYCGYIGGDGNDRGMGIAVDALGHAYVCGDAASDQSTFPVLVGPDLSQNGDRDAFVAKVETTFLELRVTPFPLLAGQNAQASVRNGLAQSDSYLIYSLTGPGHTSLPSFAVELDLDLPTRIGAKKISTALGEVDWDLPVPITAGGLQVWVQAMQYGRVSNVVITRVQ
jgi:beta-propeller repeat-containing protein